MSELLNTSPTPVTPPENNGGNTGDTPSPAWLPERLLRAQEAERKRLYAELGIDDPKAAKQLIADALQRQQADMTAAQKAQVELEKLKPKAERMDEYEAGLREIVDARIAALPKQYKSLVPDYDDPLKTLKWLDANATAFTLPAVPNLGAGAQGDQQTATPKSDVEALDNARRMGMGEADLTALKAFLAKQRTSSA